MSMLNINWRPKPLALFGSGALLAGMILYAVLYVNTIWNPYAVWIAAWTAVAFVLYAFDKAMAIRKGPRVPKLVLHGLALLGGFVGGWAGMALFHHKVMQADFWIVLIASTLGHATLTCVWFVV